MKNNTPIIAMVLGLAIVASALIITGEYKNFIANEFENDDQSFVENTDSNLASYLANQSSMYESIDISSHISRQLDDNEAQSNGYLVFPTDDQKKYVYTVHNEIQDVPELVSFDGMNAICYPGALVGLDIQNDQTIISKINLPRAPMTLTIVGLETTPGIDSTKLSIVCNDGAKSSVTAAVARLTDSINGLSNLPYKTELKINEVTNQSSLNAAIGMAGGFGGFSAGINVDFASEIDYHTTVIVFKQISYTVEMDTPLTANKLFTNDVSYQDVKSTLRGSQSLAYTNVQYGKVVVITIKSQKDSSAISAELGSSFGNYAELQAKLKSMANNSNNEIHLFAYGTSDNGLVDTRDVNQITKYLASDNGVPVPIGYIFCSPDGNILNYYIKSEYTTRQIVDNTESDGLIHIRKAEDVKKIVQNPSGRFSLDTSLNITSPLLTNSVFRGELIGNNNTISFTCYDATEFNDEHYVALFPVASCATVTDLIVNCTIQLKIDDNNNNKSYLGAIFGKADNCTVKNCTIGGSITTTNNEGNSDSYGGCIAGVFCGEINDCKCTAGLSIWGFNTYVGGLIGKISVGNTEIKNSSFDANLHCYGACGIETIWILGLMHEGPRSGNAYAGGLVGYVEATIKIIEGCQSKSNDIFARATNQHIGGLIGYSNNYLNNNGCIYEKGSLYTQGYGQTEKVNQMDMQIGR